MKRIILSLILLAVLLSACIGKADEKHMNDVNNVIVASILMDKNGNKIKIADEKARADIEALKAIVGTGGGTTDATTSGAIVTVTPASGTTARVVSKIAGQDVSWRESKKIRLAHIKGKNLLDISGILGGAGSEYEAAGIRASVNDDGTMSLSGTYTSDASYVDMFNIQASEIGYFVFPSGTYTIPTDFQLSLHRPDKDWTYIKNVRDTFTMDESFFVAGIKFTVIAGQTYGHKVPLAMVSGSDMPSAGLAYEGDTYEAIFTSAISDAVFDWQTGELKDAAGNLVETITGFGEFDVYDGSNTFVTSNGETTVTSKENGVGSKNEIDENAVNALIAEAIKFDPSVWGLPVLELSGDTAGMTKDEAVDLSYVYGDMGGTCSVKWQGSSSVRYAKKNYTIKFDKAFEAKEGWGEQNKYCFKANYIDHSHARNVVNAKLWGQIVKSRSDVPAELASLPNAGAVDGFPCIIILNGAFHGLYTFNIPKDGWMFGMGNGTNEAILCADEHVSATNFKAEATLTDDFELEYVTNEDDADWVTESVNTLINACINSDGSNLDSTIAQYVDWQSVIDYYIFTVMVGGGDMMDKNYILATFDGTKWYFSAYDMDCTYGLHWDGSSWEGAFVTYPTFAQYASAHRAMELVKTYKKDELKARYAQLRAGVLSESNIATIFANFTGAIASPVYMQDVNTWPMIPNTSTNNISQIRDWYRLRCEVADKWMEQL